jgi:pimeloyl-ACP methyl ester carboxylesterase
MENNVITGNRLTSAVRDFGMKLNARTRRLIARAALLATTSGIALFGQAHAQDAIIFIHGFDPNYRNEITYRSQDCSAVFNNALNFYRARTTKSLVTFGLYDRSSNCNFYAYNNAFIQPGGTRDSHFGRNNATSSQSDVYAFSSDKSIRHLGYRLAWFIYNNYSKNGRSVSIVGHSMGGLVARYAVGQVSSNNPEFPPFLYVRGLAMLGTPNGGSIWAGACLLASPVRQCQEMAVGSSFLSDLNNRIDFGNSGITSRLSMNRGQGTTGAYDGVAYDYNDLVATQVRYYDPIYGHGDYHNDTSTLLNARITFNVVSRNSSGVLQRTTGTSTTAERGLRMMYKYTVF